MDHYKLDKVVRGLGDPAPPLSLKEMRGAISLILKTGTGCDNIAYDSLLPTSYLKVGTELRLDFGVK